LAKGFGIAYEKFVLSKIFDDLVKRYQIKTVCEFPLNNLMRNNSEEFEALGCKVVRQPIDSKETTEKFDLVWCFCEVEQQDNPSFLIKRILDKSRRFVLIVTQNRRNLGVTLHYIHHILAGRKWNHGHLKYMTTSIVEKELKDKNVSIIKRGAFDVPWFILDVYEDGTVLRRVVPKSLLSKKIGPSIFEGLPFPLKKWLSHHLYVLCEKKIKSS
jgi:hypothetical protein